MASTDLSINVNVAQALRNIDTLSSKMDGLTNLSNKISTALGAIGTAVSATALAQFSDSITNISNRLVTISKDAGDASRQFAALAAIAIDTRSSFEGVSAVYNKMMMSSKTLGISQKDAAGYTRTLAEALALTGATTAEANSVLLQFSQGLSSGRFQGDELRAILEGNIVIVQALAKEMGVSTTQIKQLGSEGKITAGVMLNALKNSADEISASFAKMTPTISQAFEVLKTSSMTAFAEFEKYTQTGEKVAYAIEYLAMMIQKFGQTIDQYIGPIMTFGKILLELLSVLAIGKAFTIAYEAIALFGGGIRTVITAILNIPNAFKAVIGSVEDFAIVFGKLFTRGLPDGMKISEAMSGIGKGVEKASGKVASFADNVGAIVKSAGVVAGGAYIWDKLGDAGNTFDEFGNKTSDVRKEIEDFQKTNSEAAIAALSDSKTRAEAISTTSKQVTEQISRETAALNKLVAAYKDATEASMSKFRNDTEALAMNEKQRLSMEQQTQAFDNYKSKIDEIRADIAAKQATGSEADLAMIPKLEAALISLTDTYNKQQEAINGLVEARVAAEAAAAMETFKTKERIDLENQLIKLGDERATSTMSEIEKKYYDIDAAAKAAAKSQIEAEEARRGPGVRLSAEEAKSYYDVAAQGSERLKSIAKDNYDYSRSFETGWKKAFQSYADNATNAAQQAQKIFQNVTQGLEDMIIKFTKTGKFEWQNFLDSMVEMLLRSQIQQLMANIFGGFGGGTGTGGNGGGGLLSLLGFANGGLIPTNGPVLVGERGPEILTGAGGRTVIPNGAMAANSVTYNINAVDAMSFKQMIAKDPTFLYAVTEQGRRRLPGGR